MISDCILKKMKQRIVGTKEDVSQKVSENECT